MLYLQAMVVLHLRGDLDAEIKELGAQNSYLPVFVCASVLEREKDNIGGPSPEVTWIIRAGTTDLEGAIRTPEIIIYPNYANWTCSHRDLPLKLNQWTTVVRWELKSPQPFLYKREFLWQEGHKEADVKGRQILELNRRVDEDLLAVPVILGVKSEKEKVVRGLYTQRTRRQSRASSQHPSVATRRRRRVVSSKVSPAQRCSMPSRIPKAT